MSQSPAPASSHQRLFAPLLRGLLADKGHPPFLRCLNESVHRQAAEAGLIESDQVAVLSDPPVQDLANEHHQIRTALGGRRPRVILVQGVGLFVAADHPGQLRELAEAVEQSLAPNISLEKTLASIPRRPRIEGRLSGKVAMVTGAAQGFGYSIAAGLLDAGAMIALADINPSGVEQAAARLGQDHGADRVIPLVTDVTDSQSVHDAMAQTSLAFGGLDLLIANAGVLRAGSVMDMSVRDFDFVTSVNYKGYFLCVQQAAPLMAMQHLGCTNLRSDIIQINSKSGLQGSNRNAAYAGSKFGSIGLTQSFALELIDHGIKVNSICPGNFFDGPLWSDPNNGLLVQYLKTGKVPGAHSVEDVRRFYEDKIPMRRGCSAEDVLKAILYLVEQPYETGQALPVTGGQVMLH